MDIERAGILSFASCSTDCPVSLKPHAKHDRPELIHIKQPDYVDRFGQINKVTVSPSDIAL